MSHNPEEDYPNNIDEQLLTAVKDQVVNHHDLEDARVKLEEIASAAALSEKQEQQRHQQQQHLHQQQQQQQLNHHDSKDHLHQQQHHHQQQQQVQDQQQQQQQLQLHLQLYQQQQQQQQQHQVQHQHQHQHQQHQHQHQQHVHNPHGYSVDDSEYNIQIPEPIIDNKLKIYPVSENTITAEGNLITRAYAEQIFNNREDLNYFIQEFAKDNGFGVVIAHSNKKAIYFTCELGGRYRHKKSGKDGNQQIDELTNESPNSSQTVDLGNGYMIDPNTKTKKLRCPFSMTASFKKSTSMWTLRTTCNEHNHPQLDPLSNHPMLRKRSDELNSLILDLYKVGTKPSHIEKKIKEQYPEVLIKREDIYNEIRGYKRKLKKQPRFSSNLNANISRLSSITRRSINNQSNYQPVLDNNQQQQHHHNHNDHDQLNHNDDDHNGISERAIEYEIERQQQEAELQRHLQQQQIDEQQLQHYQQQLQEHGIDTNDNNESTAAAAIAAVAASTGQNHNHNHNANELSMDNIDSRLVGE